MFTISERTAYYLKVIGFSDYSPIADNLPILIGIGIILFVFTFSRVVKEYADSVKYGKEDRNQ